MTKKNKQTARPSVKKSVEKHGRSSSYYSSYKFLVEDTLKERQKTLDIANDVKMIQNLSGNKLPQFKKLLSRAEAIETAETKHPVPSWEETQAKKGLEALSQRAPLASLASIAFSPRDNIQGQKIQSPICVGLNKKSQSKENDAPILPKTMQATPEFSPIKTTRNLSAVG